MPIVIFMFWMGITPQPFLKRISPSVAHYLQTVSKKEKIFVMDQRPALEADVKGSAEVPKTTSGPLPAEERKADE